MFSVFFLFIYRTNMNVVVSGWQWTAYLSLWSKLFELNTADNDVIIKCILRLLQGDIRRLCTYAARC